MDEELEEGEIRDQSSKLLSPKQPEEVQSADPVKTYEQVLQDVTINHIENYAQDEHIFQQLPMATSVQKSQDSEEMSIAKCDVTGVFHQEQVLSDIDNEDKQEVGVESNEAERQGGEMAAQEGPPCDSQSLHQSAHINHEEDIEMEESGMESIKQSDPDQLVHHRPED
jgi:hypothetical protein